MYSVRLSASGKERVRVAEETAVQRGRNLRELSNAKMTHSADLQEALEAQHAARQAEFLAAQLEEEIRLEKHREQQAITSCEKSEQWSQAPQPKSS